MRMWYESFKMFFKCIICKSYVWLPAVALTPCALYNSFIKPLLPDPYQWEMRIPSEYIFLILFLVFCVAAVQCYHELRMKRLDELYRYMPEAIKDKVLRIFYQLYLYGELLKTSSTERKQKWDDDVFREINNYCTDSFKNNYLLGTGRRYGKFAAIEDVHYGEAVSIIKCFIEESDFARFLRL